VTPAEMVWPADEFFIRIEPMKVVCLLISSAKVGVS
jgi:hypothetical protein